MPEPTSRRSSRWPAGQGRRRREGRVRARKPELARIQWTQVETRRRQDLQQDGGDEDRRRLPRLRLDGVARPQGIDKAPEWVHRAAVVLQGVCGDGARPRSRRGRHGWRRSITLDAPLLSQDFQNAAFDFFGTDAQRPAATACPLEARRAARQRHDGRSARPALRRQSTTGGRARHACRR